MMHEESEKIEKALSEKSIGTLEKLKVEHEKESENIK
jgi:hypothetical protein